MKQSQFDAVPGSIAVVLTGVQLLVDVEAVAIKVDLDEDEIAPYT